MQSFKHRHNIATSEVINFGSLTIFGLCRVLDLAQRHIHIEGSSHEDDILNAARSTMAASGELPGHEEETPGVTSPGHIRIVPRFVSGAQSSEPGIGGQSPGEGLGEEDRAPSW